MKMKRRSRLFLGGLCLATPLAFFFYETAQVGGLHFALVIWITAAVSVFLIFLGKALVEG